MTEKFDSLFHKNYVRGEGEVVGVDAVSLASNTVRVRTYEEVLAEYRWYIRDPEADLPEEIVKQLRVFGIV